MKKESLGLFLVLGAFVVLAAAFATQAVIGQPSVSSVGSNIEGDSVWWSKEGVGTINVTPHTVLSGSEVEFSYDKAISVTGSIDVGAWFEDDLGVVKVFRVLRWQNLTRYGTGCTTQEVVNLTTLQVENQTICTTEPYSEVVQEWVDVQPNKEVFGGRTYYYITLDNAEPVKAVVKSFASGKAKYNVVVKRTSDAWDTQARVEVDPHTSGVTVPNAVFYSSYDTDTSDEAANPVNVTQHGSPRINTSVFKVGTGSLYLDNNSWLTLPRNDVANKTNLTGNMTVVAWINVTQISVYSSIIGESTPRTGCGQNCGFALILWSVSNHLSGSLAATNSTNTNILNSGSTLNTNTWYFVVWRYDVTANNFSLILNAAETQQATPATAFNMHPAADYITIGNKSQYIVQDGTEDAFKGHIDNVCIFDQALNVTQIDALYSSGTGEHCPVAGGGSSNANETEGDNAIETAINSSVPNATKYKSQQVYIVNSSNSQSQGTVDYLVIQNSPQRRWLINYITVGESYLNATNLSNTVYVLEITDKIADHIVHNVSTLLNSTKT